VRDKKTALITGIIEQDGACLANLPLSRDLKYTELDSARRGSRETARDEDTHFKEMVQGNLHITSGDN